MEVQQFKTNVQKLTKQRNVAYLLVIVLGLALLFLSLTLFFKKERIVVVPTIGESYVLGASDEVYIEKMGVFLSNMMLNRSPVDAAWRNQIILKHTDPSFYHELKRKLNEELKFLNDNKEQTFIFYPDVSEARQKDLSFVTEGARVVFVGSEGEKSHISQEDRQRYRFGFRKRGDQLLLVSIKKEKF